MRVRSKAGETSKRVALSTPSPRQGEPRSRGTRTPPADGDTQRILRHWRDAVPDDRMAHLIKDATRALIRALQRRLVHHQVSFGHWTFLRILWEADGLTQRELSREAGVMEPTTFAALTAMASRGYVLRRRLGGNRRKVHIFLTEKGRLLKRALVPLAEEVNGLALRGVSAVRSAALRRTLLAILENLAQDELSSGGDPRRRPRMISSRRVAPAGRRAASTASRARPTVPAHGRKLDRKRT